MSFITIGRRAIINNKDLIYHEHVSQDRIFLQFFYPLEHVSQPNHIHTLMIVFIHLK